MTLICVTLHDGDDWNDHMALLDFGFASYHMETAVSAGQVLASVLVRGGTSKTVTLAAKEDLRYPVADGERLTVEACVPVLYGIEPYAAVTEKRREAMKEAGIS